jgi:hypothetical protein
LFIISKFMSVSSIFPIFDWKVVCLPHTNYKPVKTGDFMVKMLW